MAELDGQLTALSARQAERLDALADMPATTLGEAVGLMVVAAHLLQYEDDPSHKLIRNGLALVGAQV